MCSIGKKTAEYLPDRIPSYSVSELIRMNSVRMIRPTVMLNKAHYQSGGRTPIVTQAKESVSGYCNETDPHIPDGIYVCFGDHSENIKYMDRAFVTGSSGMIVMSTDDRSIDARYFYHALSGRYRRNNNYERHLRYLQATVIPLPPVNVQREIAWFLDELESKMTDLNEKLKDELHLRRQQYQAILNGIFDFRRLSPKCVKRMGELYEIRKGIVKDSSAFGKGTPVISVSEILDHRFIPEAAVRGRVALTPAEASRFDVKAGDLFFSRSAETLDTVGRASMIDGEIPACTFSSFVLRARPKTDLLLPAFCVYYLSSADVRHSIMQKAVNTTRASVSTAKIADIRVPIVPKEQQRQIVTALNRCDALFDGIIRSVQDEILMRRKQYEYCRSKLLSL